MPGKSGKCGLGLVVRPGLCCHISRPNNKRTTVQRKLGRNFMRKLILGGIAAVFMLAPAAALADDPIVIKFSHVVANDTPKGMGSFKFKELPENYTTGKVKMKVNPNSWFYKANKQIERRQLGAVQLLSPSTAKL